ncbi:MAG: hypothetical protein M3Y33_03985 [Actinomycetota bacterium]|nr:hypothetical protein [Actinomycetota bacterium]
MSATTQLRPRGQLPDGSPPAKRDPLPGSWLDLRPRRGDTPGAKRDATAAELSRELATAHPLHGQPVQALAQCGHCDSVRFTLPGGRGSPVSVAMVVADAVPGAR